MTTPTGVRSGPELAAPGPEWLLWADWCAATGRPALPLASAALVEFLTDCRAAAGTQAKRVRAIDRAAIAAGYPPVERTEELLTVLRGGRPARPPRETLDGERVEAALRALPSHRWTAGWFGRRDRALLVLSHVAGLPYRQITQLRAADVTFADDGTATVNAPNGVIHHLPPGPDPSTCPPCMLARWLQVLDLAIDNHRLAATYLANKARAVTATSPHRCPIPRPWRNQTTAGISLLPPSDRWGSLPADPVPAMSAWSLSALTRSHGRGRHPDRWNGDAARRHPDQTAEPAEPTTPPAHRYGHDEWLAALQRRKDDLDKLAGIDDLLDDVDRRAKELEPRTRDLLS